MSQNTEHEAVPIIMVWVMLLLQQQCLQVFLSLIITLVYFEPEPLEHVLQVLWTEKRGKKKENNEMK